MRDCRRFTEKDGLPDDRLPSSLHLEDMSPRIVPIAAFMLSSLAVAGCDRVLTGCGEDASPDAQTLCAELPPEEAEDPSTCAGHEGSDSLFGGEGVCLEGVEDRSGPCEVGTWGFCGAGDGVQYCDGEYGYWQACEVDVGCTDGEVFEDTDSYEDEICGHDTYVCESFGGVSVWRYLICNTPLVLRFDDTPVAMTALPAAASTQDFAIAGAGSCTATDWPAASNPWLVLDRDGDGQISGGHELFGSGSPMPDGARPEHGFQPLALLDANGDGRVDAKDPDFARLRLWRDRDGDRISRPRELSSLDAEGIRELSLDVTVDVVCDDRGNCGRERAAVHTLSGRAAELVDMYLPCRG